MVPLISIILPMATALVIGFSEAQLIGHKDPYVIDYIDAGGFTKIGNNFYALREKKVTWIDALTDCALHDSELATIETMEDLTAIGDFLNRINITNDHGAWVSARDEFSHQTFRWIYNGKEVSPSFWQIGQPDNPKTEHCVHLWAKKDPGVYRLNNLPCDNKKPFYLCEKKSHKGIAIQTNPNQLL